jgi:TolB protein
MTQTPPSNRFESRRLLLGGLLATSLVPAFAQFRVEVTGVGTTQLPIAVAAFRGDDAAPQKIAAIVQADLERSGQFRAVDAAGVALDETSRPMWPCGASARPTRW